MKIKQTNETCGSSIGGALDCMMFTMLVGRPPAIMRVCTHLLHESLHANPATNASAFISKAPAAVSHIPQLRQRRISRFHGHRRARGLVGIFARRHGCAQCSVKLSQIVDDVAGCCCRFRCRRASVAMRRRRLAMRAPVRGRVAAAAYHGRAARAHWDPP